MRIIYKYSVGYGRHEDEFELDDGATDDEIEEAVKEAVFEKLDWSWSKENEG